MKHVNKAAVPSFKSGTGDLKILLSSSTVGAENGMLGHGWMEPGTSIPVPGEVSVHPVEEYSYVVRGEIAVWVEGEERTLRVGDSMYIPAGQRHLFKNEGSEPAEFVWFLSPGMKL